MFGQCHGQLAQVPDGRVVLVHDHRYPYNHTQTIGRVSADRGGRIWSRQAYHLTDGIGYSASVVSRDGTITTLTGNTPLDAQARPTGPYGVLAIRWRLHEG
ncbi:MAG: hypothetical protein AB1505_22070 [Candidatus Latescibacterota bacterium]